RGFEAVERHQRCGPGIAFRSGEVRECRSRVAELADVSAVRRDRLVPDQRRLLRTDRVDLAVRLDAHTPADSTKTRTACRNRGRAGRNDVEAGCGDPRKIPGRRLVLL